MAWPYKKIKECCNVIGGATPKRDVPEYWGNDIPWITPKDISNLDQPILEDAPEYISQTGFDSTATYLLPKGSILLTSRAPIGNVAIAGREMCTNQGFKSLVPCEGVNSSYLYHCMKRMAPKLEAIGNGATFKEVSKSIVEGFEIPLPPLPEQKRIAAILDKADAIRRKRQQAIQLADEFLRAVFLDMFGDPGLNPKNWPMGTIRDLAEDVRYGSSAKAGQDGNFPMLRMNNITYTGGWDFSNLKYIHMSEKDQEKYLVRQGEILFNRTNSKELVGKTAVYREEEPMAFAGYLIRIRTNKLANPEYIAAYLNSKHGKTTLQSMCKSIVGMANINAQEMQDIKIALPPRSLQDQYAKIVNRTLKHRAQHLIAKDKSNNLFCSLSQRSFRGELQ